MRLLGLLVAGGLASACAGAPPREPASPPEPSADALDGLVRWRAQGIRDYTVRLTVGCMCRHRGEYLVTVRDGGFRSAVSSAGTLVDADVAVLLPTVDGLYRQIADAMLAGMPMRVALDPELNYPRDVVLGTPENDAGVTYLMRDLRPAGR